MYHCKNWLYIVKFSFLWKLYREGAIFTCRLKVKYSGVKCLVMYKRKRLIKKYLAERLKLDRPNTHIFSCRWKRKKMPTLIFTSVAPTKYIFRSCKFFGVGYRFHWHCFKLARLPRNTRGEKIKHLSSNVSAPRWLSKNSSTRLSCLCVLYRSLKALTTKVFLRG